MSKFFKENVVINCVKGFLEVKKDSNTVLTPINSRADSVNDIEQIVFCVFVSLETKLVRVDQLI